MRFAGIAARSSRNSRSADLASALHCDSNKGPKASNLSLELRMSQEPLWKAVVAVGILLLFAAVGVYAAFRPDLFVSRPLLWKQGDMERTMNRDEVRVVGAIFAAVALWMLYSLMS